MLSVNNSNNTTNIKMRWKVSKPPRCWRDQICVLNRVENHLCQIKGHRFSGQLVSKLSLQKGQTLSCEVLMA